MQQVYITKEALKTRQHKAYAAGKQAWREDHINGQTLQLYEELVRRVGTNAYCWIGEEALATELGRSESTIKRWMRQLVGACLIRRERQFGHTTHTFITAYDQHDITQIAQTTTVAFFEPTSDPTIRSDLPRDSIKDQHFNAGGGGDIEVENETTLRLQDEGITDQTVLNELHDRSLDEVDTVVRYAARCRKRHDPRRPGLIVHLLRRPEHLPPCRYQAVPDHASSRSEKPSEFPIRDITLDTTWTAVLNDVATEVPSDVFTTWLRPTTLLDLDGTTAVIGAPNVFVRDELERFRPLIVAALHAHLGIAAGAEFVIGTG